MPSSWQRDSANEPAVCELGRRRWTRLNAPVATVVEDDLRRRFTRDKRVNHALMTPYAACGDVVRNVMTTSAPRRDVVHTRLTADALMLSEALLPQSRAYYQIFLDEPGDPDAPPPVEPIYSGTYLPRKFKIGLAHPGDNTVDV